MLKIRLHLLVIGFVLLSLTLQPAALARNAAQATPPATVPITPPATVSATLAATVAAPLTVTTTPVETATPAVAPPTQTPTAAPTSAPYAELGYENLFPMLIRYWTAVRIPASEVFSIKVRVFQAGVIDQEINVPTQGNVRLLNDVASIIFFSWPLTPENAPQPFKELSLTWVIESPKGNFQTSERVTFEYLDGARKWGRQPEGPIKLYWHNLNINTNFLLSNLKRTYSLLQKNADLKQEYEFVIYESGAELCDKDPQRPGQKVVIARKDNTVYPCDPTNAAKLYAARGLRLIQRSSPLLEQLQDDLIQIMANDAYGELFKNAPAPVPAWFRGGLSQLYGLVGRANALLLAREQARQDRLLSLETLASEPKAEPNDFGASLRNWNSQAYMLTLYAAAQFGASAPFDLAREAATAPTFAEAFTKISKGVTPAQFYNDWKNWLLTVDADAAIRWNIYSTQPTPTITLTPSEVPTFTPEPFVPTESPTPFPSRTPFPSLTPSPIPPTNTARPAGSLGSPTP